MRLAVAEILSTGLESVGYNKPRQSKVKEETKAAYFVSCFGYSAETYQKLFQDLYNSTNACEVLGKKPKLQDLLMTGNWMKEGITFNSLGGRWGLNPETVRKKCWGYAEAICELYDTKIVFGPWESNSNTGFDENPVFILTVDGTHYRIKEPRDDPSSKWYSHKFNSPALNYELAISTYSNKICWTSGPHPASMHDITIYRLALKDMVPAGRKVIGDSGYTGEPNTISVVNPHDSVEVKRFKQAARARHENVNGRLKEFALLDKRWVYHRNKHVLVFRSIVVMTQYNIEESRPLLDIY